MKCSSMIQVAVLGVLTQLAVESTHAPGQSWIFASQPIVSYSAIAATLMSCWRDAS